MDRSSNPRGGPTIRMIALACLGSVLSEFPPIRSAALADDPPGPNRAASPLPRLPRQDLLRYRGPDGEPTTVATVDDWLKRRGEILGAMQAVMGRLPGPEKRCPLDLKVEEEVDCGSHVRRRVTFASEPGSPVPAYLSIPKSVLRGDGKRARAVLCLHPTDDVDRSLGPASRPHRRASQG